MTKAERDEIRALAGESEWEIYNRSGGPPISCSLNDLLDHIDGLEAQLAQRDEQIRELAKAWDNWYDGPETMINSDLITAIVNLRVSLGRRDAKEGEGK